MLQSKIINGTDSELTIEEGTAGVRRKLRTIGKDKSYTVKADANATYREYWIAVPGSEQVIVISSDDIQEYSEFTIYFDKELSKLDYEGTRRGMKRNAPTNASIGQTDGNVGNTGEGGTSWFSRFFRKFF